MKLKIFIIIVIFTLINSHGFAEGTGKGVVTGRATIPSGKAMKFALAMFYLKQNGPAPLPESYWRVPDAVVPVASNGSFTAELADGEYYVGVIGRQSSKIAPGPPLDGDFLILVKDKSGNPKIISVTAGVTVNVGTQKGSVYRKVGNENDKITTIEGMIYSADGSPVSGAFVFAFHTPERGSRPVFVSDKTDKYGNYVLRVDGDGAYFLKVRTSYGGGKPQVGEQVGTFGDEGPAPVSTKKGIRQKGININVQPVQRLDGK